MTAATADALLIAACVVPAGFAVAGGLAWLGRRQARELAAEVPFSKRRPRLWAAVWVVWAFCEAFTLLGRWWP